MGKNRPGWTFADSESAYMSMRALLPEASVTCSILNSVFLSQCAQDADSLPEIGKLGRRKLQTPSLS
jgi:hypothetical protein